MSRHAKSECDTDFINCTFTTGRNQHKPVRSSPDPDGRWAARRREAIADTFEKSMRIKGSHGSGNRGSSQGSSHDLGQFQISAGKLSGESHRIGHTEWDEHPLRQACRLHLTTLARTINQPVQKVEENNVEQPVLPCPARQRPVAQAILLYRAAFSVLWVIAALTAGQHSFAAAAALRSSIPLGCNRERYRCRKERWSCRQPEPNVNVIASSVMTIAVIWR